MSQLTSLSVSISQQCLTGYDQAGNELVSYSIATAKNGIGQKMGSECTPLGKHLVRAKIGSGVKANTVFIGRRPTGEMYTEQLAQQQLNRDWILTRILWLSGCEVGHNRLGDVDTMRRYIYIHGAPDSHAMGVPSSHGCIKMRNDDIITLFDQVRVGAFVFIKQ